MRVRAAMVWGAMSCALAAAGCGGSDDASPDAAVGVDAGPDAAVDAAMLDAAGTQSLSVTPASHLYTGLKVFCTLSTVFQVTSTGSAAVGPLDTQVTGDTEFQITADTCMGQSLAPGRTCLVTVSVMSTSAGPRTALLTVASGPVKASAVLNASANSGNSLTLVPSPWSFDALPVGQTGAPVAFTVRNTGGAPIDPLVTTISGADAADFRLASNTCSAPLNPDVSCTVTLRFAPTSAGMKAATLMVAGPAPCGFRTAALSGTGVVSDLILSPGRHDFGAVPNGTSSNDVTFTATNFGAATTAALTVTLTGTDPGAFTIAGGTCVSGTTTLGSGAGCTVLVHAHPASAGPKSASLSVGPASGTAALTALTATGVTSDDIITISPSVQDFGPVAVSGPSAHVIFTVTNIGAVTWGPLGVALSGTDASSFGVTSDDCSGLSLTPGAACSITADFIPGTTGAKSASLDVTTPLAGVHASAALRGTGTPGPGDLFLSPSSVPFSDTAVGSSSAGTHLTLTNSTGAPTGVLSSALGGSDPSQFAIVAGSDHCTGTMLAIGASCTIDVAFRPTSNGAKSGQLTLNATPGGPAVADFTGTGAAP